jgi:hypothetical protein
MLVTERRTRRIALISTFAVLSTVLDMMVTPSISAGIWFGWIFVISPINGLILGPLDGFITTLISVLLGHSLVFRDSIYEFVFTLGAPICSLVTGYLVRGEWKKVFVYYTVLIAAYFLDPLSRELPIWGMWDTFLAYSVLVAYIILTRASRINSNLKQGYLFALFTFLGLEADVLFRIFVLVPCQAYRIFYGLTPESLIFIWSVPAPLVTPLKVAFSSALGFFLVPEILRILQTRNYVRTQIN